MKTDEAEVSDRPGMSRNHGIMSGYRPRSTEGCGPWRSALVRVSWSWCQPSGSLRIPVYASCLDKEVKKPFINKTEEIGKIDKPTAKPIFC